MGKKSMLMWLIICTLGVLLTAPVSYKKVNAQTVLETDVTVASDGCIFLGVYGSYHSQAQDALARINEIRKEACEEGNVPDPRDPSRMLVASDYVPIKWSTDLESVARIRAVEAGLARGFMGTGHSRLNGKDWHTITYNGISSWAEVLAYNYGTSMVSGINQWYQEKNDWVNQVAGEVTGHYTSMIDPDNTYVGLGDFYTEASGYPNTLAGEFDSNAKALDQTMQAAPSNVMQKIEVKKSYVTGYVLEGTDTIYTDKTTTLTPKAILTNGSQTQKLWILDSVEFISSDTSVATVSSEGVVTGLKKGTTTITVKSGNGILATIEITVKCNHVKVLQSEKLPTCTSTGLKVYCCDICDESAEQVIPMIAHDYIYGDIDSEGHRTGECSVCNDTIQITPPSTMTLWWRNSASSLTTYYSYFPSENPVGSTIYCWPEGVDGDSGYRDMIITSTDASVISVPETTIANYHNNKLEVLAPGIATISIYPKYNPGLKRTVIVRIGNPGSVDFLAADVTLSQTTYEYNGMECKPSVVVSYHDTVLTKGTDYTIAYENNAAIGTATVVITGKGIFAGTVRKSFTIEHDNHTYDAWKIVEETSCSKEGSKRRDCTLCDAYEMETIDMLEHKAVIDDAVAATCTATGLTEGSHCLVCSTTIVEQSIVEAYGHAYVDGKCENCGDIIYANIGGLTYTILDADAGSFAVSVKAQIGEILSGTVNIPTTICLNGQDYNITTIEQDAFAGQSEIVSMTIPATVTQVEGEAFAQCSSLVNVTFCGTTAPTVANDIFEGTSSVELIVPIDAKGYDTLAAQVGVTLKEEHVHSMIYHEAVAAGCESEGHTVYYSCDGCNAFYSDEFGNNEIVLEDTVIAATGHRWNEEYTIDVPATATTDGSKSIHCGLCSATKDQVVIPATGTQEGSGEDDGGVQDKNDEDDGGVQDKNDKDDSTIQDKNDSAVDDNKNNVVDNKDETSAEDEGNVPNNENKGLGVGKTFKINGIIYKVVVSDSKKNVFQVSCVKTSNKKIKKYTMPSYVSYNGVKYQVTSVGKKAFAGCKKLKTFTIGSNVKTIGDKAFYGCSVLKSITISSSVTKIGKEAFAKCKKLSSVKIKSKRLTASKIGKNAFKGIKANATIKVPKKKMKAYKAMLRKKGVNKKAKFKKL